MRELISSLSTLLCLAAISLMWPESTLKIVQGFQGVALNVAEQIVEKNSEKLNVTEEYFND